jgi:hypothetical protein
MNPSRCSVWAFPREGARSGCRARARSCKRAEPQERLRPSGFSFDVSVARKGMIMCFIIPFLSGYPPAMNLLAPLPSPGLPMPALVAAAGDRARVRFLEFFAANIRNPHRRRAYNRAVGEFLAWCARRAVARRHLDRGADARLRGAERQAAARRASPPVRLACDRPGRAGQPGSIRARQIARRRLRGIGRFALEQTTTTPINLARACAGQEKCPRRTTHRPSWQGAVSSAAPAQGTRHRRPLVESGQRSSKLCSRRGNPYGDPW